MLKWKNLIKPKSVPITGEHAIKCLVRVAQNQCYMPMIAQYSPRLDSEGIMRVGEGWLELKFHLI